MIRRTTITRTALQLAGIPAMIALLALPAAADFEHVTEKELERVAALDRGELNRYVSKFGAQERAPFQMLLNNWSTGRSHLENKDYAKAFESFEAIMSIRLGLSCYYLAWIAHEHRQAEAAGLVYRPDPALGIPTRPASTRLDVAHRLAQAHVAEPELWSSRFGKSDHPLHAYAADLELLRSKYDGGAVPIEASSFLIDSFAEAGDAFGAVASCEKLARDYFHSDRKTSYRLTWKTWELADRLGVQPFSERSARELSGLCHNNECPRDIRLAAAVRFAQASLPAGRTSKGTAEAVERNMRALLDSFEDRAEAQLIQAQLLELQWDFERARIAYAKCAQDEETREAATLHLAVLTALTGELDSTFALLQGLDAAAWRTFADAMLDRGLDDMAFAALRRVADRPEGAVASLVPLAEELVASGRPREALQVLRRAREAGRPAEEDRPLLAELAAVAGDRDAALTEIDLHLNQNPHDPDGWNALLFALAYGRDLDVLDSANAEAALVEFDQRFEHHGEPTAALLDAARLRSWMRHPSAQDFWLRAMSEDTARTEPHLAFHLARRGREVALLRSAVVKAGFEIREPSHEFVNNRDLLSPDGRIGESNVRPQVLGRISDRIRADIAALGRRGYVRILPAGKRTFLENYTVPDPVAEAAEQPVVERMSPYDDFEAETLSGEVVRLRDLRGKFVFLHFWAPYGPAKLDLPYLVEAYEQHHGEGLEIIGFCNDANADRIQALCEQTGATWPQIRGAIAWYAAFEIRATPKGVLLAPDGRVIEHGHGQSMPRGKDLVRFITRAIEDSAFETEAVVDSASEQVDSQQLPALLVPEPSVPITHSTIKETRRRMKGQALIERNRIDLQATFAKALQSALSNPQGDHITFERFRAAFAGAWGVGWADVRTGGDRTRVTSNLERLEERLSTWLKKSKKDSSRSRSRARSLLERVRDARKQYAAGEYAAVMDQLAAIRAWILEGSDFELH
ncbi:MAG: redoxin domain-containing protein [bacterium]|nr:redoxin domain-containing protein [bacterium]